MHRPLLVLTICILLLAPAFQSNAQDLELPELSLEQRLDILAFNLAAYEAAVVGLGKEHGMTPEEVGTWVGEFFSSGWVGGLEAGQVARAFSRNHLAWPDATAEVVSSSPTTAAVRFNHPEDAYWGAGGQMHGVDGADIRTAIRLVHEVIAGLVGADITVDAGKEHDVFHLTTRYGQITASNDMRWARGSYLSWLTSLQLISLQLKDGMSASEFGASQAEMYASSWTAATPWRFYRGMTWNAMMDPGHECETLSASPDEVRARCRVYYREVVEANEERFGLSVQDVFDVGRTFGEGVGDHLGFVWTETLEGDYRMITVTRK